MTSMIATDFTNTEFAVITECMGLGLIHDNHPKERDEDPIFKDRSMAVSPLKNPMHSRTQ